MATGPHRRRARRRARSPPHPPPPAPQPSGLWRKRAAPARQKRTYKTAEEVLAESQGRGLAGAGSQPILDLRGPTARVITDMEQLGKGGGGRPPRLGALPWGF
jgi:hypothetical protein